MKPLVRTALDSLRNSVLHLRRFPASDVASQMLIAELDRDVERLFGGRRSAIDFAFTADGLWFGEDLLLHESLEFADLGRQVAARGIDTISIDPGHSRLGTLALAQLIAGTGGEIPPGEGIRLNDVPVPLPIEPGSHGPGLRRAYLAAIEALRAAVFAVRTGEPVDLDHAKRVADRLVMASGGRPIATALLATMHNRSGYLFHHSVNTALLAMEMGRAAGLRLADLRVLVVGALLHDVGKAVLAPEVIDDPGPLDPLQWERLRRYPMASAAVILGGGVAGTEVAAVMALGHKRHPDGGGYPALPDGHDVHPAAALLSVVDVYEALTARRPYRRAETNGNAVRIVVTGSGSEFDPGMVNLFLGRFGHTPPGSCYRLRSGEVLLGIEAIDGGVRGLIAEDADGELLHIPEPTHVPFDAIQGELSVLETSVRPAAYLDHVEAIERRTQGRPSGGGR